MHHMTAILFSKLGQNDYQANFPSHISFVQIQATIFQDLEHLYDLQILGYGGHFVFQNEAKILHRHVFIAINIPCKFSKDIFINE